MDYRVISLGYIQESNQGVGGVNKVVLGLGRGLQQGGIPLRFY